MLTGVLWAAYYTATTGIDGGNMPLFTIPVAVLFGGFVFDAWKWFHTLGGTRPLK